MTKSMTIVTKSPNIVTKFVNIVTSRKRFSRDYCCKRLEQISPCSLTKIAKHLPLVLQLELSKSNSNQSSAREWENETGPQKMCPGFPPPSQNSEPFGGSAGVPWKGLHTRKPAEEPSHRTAKVLQSFGNQAQPKKKDVGTEGSP